MRTMALPCVLSSIGELPTARGNRAPQSPTAWPRNIPAPCHPTSTQRFHPSQPAEAASSPPPLAPAFSRAGPDSRWGLRSRCRSSPADIPGAFPLGLLRDVRPTDESAYPELSGVLLEGRHNHRLTSPHGDGMEASIPFQTAPSDD